MLATIQVSPWEIVGTVVAVFTALVAARGDNAIARAFRGAAARSVTEASANAAVALVARVDQLETQVKALSEENKLLKELVTHSAKVDELSKKIDEYQRVVERALAMGGPK